MGDPFIEAMLNNEGKESLAGIRRRKSLNSNNGWKKKNKELYNYYCEGWKGNVKNRYPFYYLLEKLRLKAKKEGLQFNLDYRDWVEVPTKCASSGMSIEWTLGPKQKHSLVFDRVDRALGWVKGNVWIVAYGRSHEYREKMEQRKNKVRSVS